MTALRSWGIPDNPPDVVEHAYDGGGKKLWPPFDGDDRRFSCQRPHSMLRIRKPVVYWRLEAQAGEQSPPVCGATQASIYPWQECLGK